MDGKYLVGAISILVVVVLVGSVTVPIIDMSTSGGVEYEDNPDWAGWVRFDLNKSADAAYHLTISQDENGIYVENIVSDTSDIQTYDDSSPGDYETIMYADSNTVIWSVDDNFNVMGKVNGNPVYLSATSLDIVRSAGGVEINIGVDTITFDTPTWAYVPFSEGKYGFYPYDADRGVKHPADAPVSVLGGGFAGVYAYNDIYRYDGLGLTMSQIIEDGLFYGASWSKTAIVDTQNEEPTDITFDPSVIQPIDDPFDTGMGLMSVPTPTYTDGVWGYNLITIDGDTKAAIVSYSGTGGDVVVPATVGGYDVYRLGIDISGNNVFDNSTISSGSTLTISNGIVEIGNSALRSATNFTGSLIIPDSVTSIPKNAFSGCSGFTGSLTIGNSVTTIGNGAFQNCSGFTGSLTIGNSVTTIGNYAFNGLTHITGSLILPDSVTSIGNGTFQSLYDVSVVVLPSSLTQISDYAFGGVRASDLIISVNAIPAGSHAYGINASEVLDLSDTIDYSVDRYGIPADATVSDSIGDCFGFVSIVSTPSGTPGALGAYSPLLYAIPVLILAGLLVGVAAVMLRRDY